MQSLHAGMTDDDLCRVEISRRTSGSLVFNFRFHFPTHPSSAAEWIEAMLGEDKASSSPARGGLKQENEARVSVASLLFAAS